jgi:hypothetical protein
MANKRKPVIPEPSHRLFVWSLVAGFLLIAAILGYSFANGDERLGLGQADSDNGQHSHASARPDN